MAFLQDGLERLLGEFIPGRVEVVLDDDDGGRVHQVSDPRCASKAAQGPRERRRMGERSGG